ncbi:hypothetical protein [Cupriavidus sp. DF5525]|uniref:hypothetical protein n=1 Tax=Cupriavidus sp. DF5525 TaxID=3160989 RepID=UPI0032DE7AA2
MLESPSGAVYMEQNSSIKNGGNTIKRLIRTRDRQCSLEDLVVRLQIEVRDLQGRLRAERRLIQEMATRCRTLPSIFQGRRGEYLIADTTKWSLMPYAAKFDVRTPERARIEVKFSPAYDKSNEDYSECRERYSKTFVWLWPNVLGSAARPKRYDFLVLIGEMPGSAGEDLPPLVYFLLHRSEVEPLTTVIGAGGRLGIQLGTKFDKVKSTARPLIQRQVKLTDLEGFDWKKLRS